MPERGASPVIIEAALNGATDKMRNRHVPISPGEIVADALCCLTAGATIIHNHIEDIWLTGTPAAARYDEGWAPVLHARPDAILCPTATLAPTIAERVAHLAPCARAGARMGALDPGSINLANTAPDGTPGSRRFDYFNGYDDIDVTVSTLAEAGLAASIAIYEPTFLRAALAYHRAGRLRPGSILKLYFSGPCDMLPGEERPNRPALGFGLPPTEKALEAYLEMIGDSGMPWSVAVLGGDAVSCGIARLALERGGHLRVGLEDHAGPGEPTNLMLVEAAVALCAEAGRPIATSAEAATLLGLPAV